MGRKRSPRMHLERMVHSQASKGNQGFCQLTGESSLKHNTMGKRGRDSTRAHYRENFSQETTISNIHPFGGFPRAEQRAFSIASHTIVSGDITYALKEKNLFLSIEEQITHHRIFNGKIGRDTQIFGVDCIGEEDVIFSLGDIHRHHGNAYRKQQSTHHGEWFPTWLHIVAHLEIFWEHASLEEVRPHTADCHSPRLTRTCHAALKDFHCGCHSRLHLF